MHWEDAAADQRPAWTMVLVIFGDGLHVCTNVCWLASATCDDRARNNRRWIRNGSVCGEQHCRRKRTRARTGELRSVWCQDRKTTVVTRFCFAVSHATMTRAKSTHLSFQQARGDKQLLCYPTKPCQRRTFTAGCCVFAHFGISDRGLCGCAGLSVPLPFITHKLL